METDGTGKTNYFLEARARLFRGVSPALLQLVDLSGEKNILSCQSRASYACPQSHKNMLQGAISERLLRENPPGERSRREKGLSISWADTGA
jgi:hypothetical protein